MIVQPYDYGGFVLAYPFNVWMVLIAAGFTKASRCPLRCPSDPLDVGVLALRIHCRAICLCHLLILK
jgi:hypothetical protein